MERWRALRRRRSRSPRASSSERFGGMLIPHVRDTDAGRPAAPTPDPPASGSAWTGARGHVPRHRPGATRGSRTSPRRWRLGRADVVLALVGTDPDSGAGRRLRARIPGLRLVGRVPIAEVPALPRGGRRRGRAAARQQRHAGPGPGQALRRHGPRPAHRVHAGVHDPGDPRGLRAPRRAGRRGRARRGDRAAGRRPRRGARARGGGPAPRRSSATASSPRAASSFPWSTRRARARPGARLMKLGLDLPAVLVPRRRRDRHRGPARRAPARGHDGRADQHARPGAACPASPVRPLPVAAPSLRAPPALVRARRPAPRRRGADYDLVQSHERALGQDLYRAGEGCHRGVPRGHGPAAGARARIIGSSCALERRIFQLRAARHVVAISRRARPRSSGCTAPHPARVTLVYNGVDLERFHPDTRAPPPPPDARARSASPRGGVDACSSSARASSARGSGPLLEAFARVGGSRAAGWSWPARETRRRTSASPRASASASA